jgi:hypothetical protein
LSKAAAVTAIIGTCIAGILAWSALDAALARERYDVRHATAASVGRYALRTYRCKGGFSYTYLGGWGCDYYLSPPGLRRNARLGEGAASR